MPLHEALLYYIKIFELTGAQLVKSYVKTYILTESVAQIW